MNRGRTADKAWDTVVYTKSVYDKYLGKNTSKTFSGTKLKKKLTVLERKLRHQEAHPNDLGIPNTSNVSYRTSKSVKPTIYIVDGIKMIKKYIGGPKKIESVPKSDLNEWGFPDEGWDFVGYSQKLGYSRYQQFKLVPYKGDEEE